MINTLLSKLPIGASCPKSKPQQPFESLNPFEEISTHPLYDSPVGNEDLRQDERVMQLFGLINTLLSKSPTTSERQLSIQRYSVIPLSTNSGMKRVPIHLQGGRAPYTYKGAAPHT